MEASPIQKQNQRTWNISQLCGKFTCRIPPFSQKLSEASGTELKMRKKGTTLYLTGSYQNGSEKFMSLTHQRTFSFILYSLILHEQF